MNYGKAIRHCRLKRNVTQVYLAEKTGLTQTGISLMETGARRPRETNLQKIAEVLKVPTSYLIFKAIEWDSFSYTSEQQRQKAEANLKTVDELLEEIINT